MSKIGERIHSITSTLPQGVNLVAVSKFHPMESLQKAYDAGQRIFGESHAVEMAAKAAALPGDIEWHFIGHLQTNKVKLVVPVATLIHSVDSVRLLREINKCSAKINKVSDCLIQIHVATEDTKYGFTPEECRALFSSDELPLLPNVRVVGLMCMASNVDDEAQIASEFAQAKALFDEIRQIHYPQSPHFRQKSWGMSDDYPIAIAHGSTLIRVGTKIFGEREY